MHFLRPKRPFFRQEPVPVKSCYGLDRGQCPHTDACLRLMRPERGDLLALVMGLRLLARLPGYLRNPLTIAEARAILRRRLEQREEDFLVLIKRAVFGNPTSPYRALLRQAGCEYGDR